MLIAPSFTTPSEGVPMDVDDAKLLDDVIVHLFLPKKTPAASPKNVEEIERAILQYFVENVNTVLAEGTFPQLRPVQVMLQKWKDLDNLKSVDNLQQFQQEMKSLGKGTTIPVYIRQQNCTLLISRDMEDENGENVTVSTFRSSLPATTVMSSIGSHSMSFPETREQVQNKTLLSFEGFPKLLQELSSRQLDITQPVTFKGGRGYPKLRDVANPFLVQDWVVGLLLPAEAKSLQNLKQYSIKKKIRDQINLSVVPGSSELLPFRRSGIYMSLKVTLQLKLLEIFDDEVHAKLVYKLLMLQLLTEAVKMICDRNDMRETVDFDMCSQMLAKIGRRAKKLEKFAFDGDHSTGACEQSMQQLMTDCLNQTHRTVTRLSRQISDCWNAADESAAPKLESRKRLVNSEAEFAADLQHKLTLLDEYVANTNRFFNGNARSNASSLESIPVLKRYFTFQDILSGAGYFSTENDRRAWILDIENYIKYYCTSANTDAVLMNDLLDTYENHVQCQHDPLGMSQYVLVTLKGFQIMDEIATKEYPLLLEYKVNLNPHHDAFAHLLLPYYQDMLLLKDVLNYFNNRDNRASHKELLQGSVDETCFSVRFAMNNELMMELRRTILEDTKKKTDAKYWEVETARQECKHLQRRIAEETGCHCQYRREYYTNYHGYQKSRSVRVFCCQKCSLGAELERKRYSVGFYEKPLPSKQVLQRAVVFELVLPEIFSLWRDRMAYFKYYILGEPAINEALAIKWRDYRSLSSYVVSTRTKNNPHLGSTPLPVSTTFYSKQNLDVLSDSNESFVVENGMTCDLRYSSSATLTEDWIASCAFKIRSTSDAHTYSTLQTSLNSWTHSQNEILTNQIDCHPKLALHEFIAFGSLRAGHRIHLRNLYETLHSGTLSLEKEPVLALILQTLWQVGPRCQGNDAESHFDFQNDSFAEEFLELLDKLVKTNEMNYSNSLIGVITVSSARRIAELNVNLRDKCYRYLQQWRSTFDKWIFKIKEELKKPEVVAAKNGVASLKKNLFEVVLCVFLSFSVMSKADIGNVLKEKQDYVQWFSAIYEMRELDEQKVPKSGFVEIVTNFAKQIPLRLQLELGLQQRRSQNFHEEALHAFICQKWNKALHCTLERVNCPFRSNVVFAEYRDTASVRHKVTFDLLLGRFLVNGYSQSELSGQLRNSKLFQWYFRNIASLQVQRDSENLTRTVSKYQGQHYEFHTNFPADEGVLIKEVHDDGTSLVLVDSAKFGHSVSNYYLVNHTHWMDVVNQIVYFRPRKDDAENSNIHDFTLQKNEEGSWQMYDVGLREYILSPHSNGFADVSNRLERFELSMYINATRNSEGTTTAHLRRYRLRFRIRKGSNQGLLESIEYPGYSLATIQKYPGTLVGLQNGLILENGERSLFLIPHATICVSQGLSHQVITLPLGTLRNPPCHDYEVDDVLQRLKARHNKSAWLYLAALHAVTASPLPDPFTKVTGTEMAVRILQSACVWSCSPYDSESLATLQFIHSLSPKRKYYGPEGSSNSGMESVEWPPHLPSMAASDGFGIIVEKLIADSNKLAMLHPPNSGPPPKLEETLDFLRVRAYHQHLPTYNSAATIQRVYFSASQQLLLNGAAGNHKTFPLRQSQDQFNIPNLQLSLFHQLERVTLPLENCTFFQKDTLFNYLIQPSSIDAPMPPLPFNGVNGFLDAIHVQCVPNWLKLYDMALNAGKSAENATSFSVVLSTLAYRRTPIQQIANLHYISVFAGKLKFPPLPPNHFYCTPSANFYNPGAIESLLWQHRKPFTALPLPTEPEPCTLCSESYRARECNECQLNRKQYQQEWEAYLIAVAEYNKIIKAHCARWSQSMSKFWPGTEVDVCKRHLEECHINSIPAMTSVNQTLLNWYRNYQLKLYVENVQGKLNEIYDIIHGENFPGESISLQEYILPESRSNALVKAREEETLDLVSLLKPNMARNRDVVAEVYASGQTSSIVNLRTLKWRRKFCKQEIQELLDELLDMIGDNITRQIIIQTGISPRMDPGSILEHLTKDNITEVGEVLRDYAGGLGVYWCSLKKLNRCIRAHNQSDVERELQNVGHENWSPKEHPEWLLLELELDIMIRPIQVDVARQMMNMPNGGNGVTQLNMGEGKTSVIVPMLCATLAKEDIQMCRVTVLSSIFKMNLTSLTFAIGGLLNRRVYSVPCRRDMDIGDLCVSSILEAYQECVSLRGVVLTLPEYRLSCRLLAYDNMFKGQYKLGLQMLGVENWLREHVRDVMDESDELFNVKYQLVYTMGTQVHLDGGDMRWATCQKLLGFLLKVAGELLNQFGTSVIEFDRNTQNRKPHQFSTFRLLNKTCVDTLVDVLADKFLEEMRLLEKEELLVKKFLVDNVVQETDHEQVMAVIFQDAPEELQKILLLSGYLRRGILSLALLKRWRVEYGVNPKPGFRLMAVPFRAKDVAAEKTEFGHPDLAIVLTHLSYYYSGLDDSQLQKTFEVLRGKQAPDALYSMWVAQIPRDQVPDCLSKYYCLNMKDAFQKSQLFEMLRKHKMVIDFWLSHCVFPRESKQFPGKLVMTAWDLCYERQQYPVTGFSGTNDSQVLLPRQITQQDLTELESTNRDVEMMLLKPENCNHQSFMMGVTCRQLLERMRQDNLTVLIDAGALMLECSNEQVATLWLEVNPDIEAVVYFSTENELLVKCRGDNSLGTPFDVSPYQGRLDKCGVFLDDQHTRGTDLKFPLGSKACVTIATRMKRDKLIQACMRMRKLGQGHTVTFYLSHEAYDKMFPGQPLGTDIPTKSILDWVCQNTKEFNENGVLYWAVAARNYAQRLAAEDIFHSPHQNKPFEVAVESEEEFGIKSRILASQCVDEEIVTLVNMYGQRTQVELLSKLVPIWFDVTKNTLYRKNGGAVIDATVRKTFEQTRSAVQEQCFKIVPKKTHVSSVSGDGGGFMEEEQEKELEMEKETEVEEERQVERPSKMNPVQPCLHPTVKRIVLSGRHHGSMEGGIVRLADLFRGATFEGELQPECWQAGGVFVTEDFVRVMRLASSYNKTDCYLRPIQYMVSVSNDNCPSEQFLLILSPFEVNELLPYLRRGQALSILHMFSLRRTENQDTLLNRKRLQLPLTPIHPRRIPEDSLQNASLLLASASLYFISMTEQKAFSRFLGLVPQPWSPQEKEAFNQGWITKGGFALPLYSRSLPAARKNLAVGFERDPTMLVKKILTCRHPLVSEMTHVMRLLEDKRYVDLPEIDAE